MKKLSKSTPLSSALQCIQDRYYYAYPFHSVYCDNMLLELLRRYNQMPVIYIGPIIFGPTRVIYRDAILRSNLCNY